MAWWVSSFGMQARGPESSRLQGPAGKKPGMVAHACNSTISRGHKER